jgi:hypothetical protein
LSSSRDKNDGKGQIAKGQPHHLKVSAMEATDVDVDTIQKRLGTGRFQLFSFLVLGLIYSRGAWHVFGIMFLAGDPGHQCALPVPERGNVSPLAIGGINYDGNGSTDISITPALHEPQSNLLYSFQGDSIAAVRINWTAETCAISYVENGSSVTVEDECPYGWAYGSIYETTVLSEV